jgi:hypothetical protein
MHQERRVTTITIVHTIIAVALWLTTSALTQAQTSLPDSQFQIQYLYPETPALKPAEALVKEFRILERVRGTMSFVKLPGPLLLRFGECKAEEAWYDRDTRTVSFCYELVAHIQRIAPKRAQAGVEPQEVIVGSVVFSLLHEIGHAFVDMLELPVLGREEDAADQMAAYILLQLDKPLPRKLVGGAAWMWEHEARSNKPDRGDLADVHSLSAQRFFNLLCMAYGSDPDTFAFLTKKGYLPTERAGSCGYEYKQLIFAVKKVFMDHVDQKLLEEMRQYRSTTPENAVSGSIR